MRHRSDVTRSWYSPERTVTPTDRELLESWAAGDVEAGAVLFSRYFEPIGRVFRNKVDEADAQDDLTQQTFETALKRAGNYRGEGSVRSFLFGVAYNLLRRHFEARATGRVDPMEHSVLDLGAGASTQLRVHDRDRKLAEAVRTLPLQLQVVLELFYWESMSAPEIGRALELPEGTVRTRLRRARQLLRQVLGEDGAIDLPLESDGTT